MGCSCRKSREQFEVVRDGGTGRTVHRSSNQAAATAVAGRYPNSVVRNAKTSAVIFPGKGSLELVAHDGTVLLRTDDEQLLAKVAAVHEDSTTRAPKTSKPTAVDR